MVTLLERIAAQFQQQAVACERAAVTASSGIARNKLMGKADAYQHCANIIRHAAGKAREQSQG